MLSILKYIMSGDYFQAIIVILSRCFVVFCCMPVHEVAHGWVAYKLGDTTAKYQGRLTLNPIAHLNPIGTLMIFLFGIGYANPVPINPNRFKNPKKGMVLTALAGPVSNIIMAFISVFIYYAIDFALLKTGSSVAMQAIAWFFYFSASVNVTLAVFNLFPIPPLDGSKVLTAVLPEDKYFAYMKYERYIMIGLMLVLFLGWLNTPIMRLSEGLMKIISVIPRLIFRV